MSRSAIPAMPPACVPVNGSDPLGVDLKGSEPLGVDVLDDGVVGVVVGGGPTLCVVVHAATAAARTASGVVPSSAASVAGAVGATDAQFVGGGPVGTSLCPV